MVKQKHLISIFKMDGLQNRIFQNSDQIDARSWKTFERVHGKDTRL